MGLPVPRVVRRDCARAGEGGRRHAVAPTPGHALLDEVVGRIRREYVEPVPESAFDAAAVKGIVANLDPHSAFLDAAEYDEMRAATTGSYTGVGIEVSTTDGRVVVVTPIEGSPAAQAGVRAGDVVLAVNDQPVTGDRLDETIGRMRGVPGTPRAAGRGARRRTRTAGIRAAAQ